MLRRGYVVVNKRKGKDGHIIHELKDNLEAAYTVVRGGLSLPTDSSRAYYCIFGEQYDWYYDYRHRETRRPLKFLAEGDAESLDRLFEELLDDAMLLGCRTCYTDSDQEDYINYLHDRMHGRNISLSFDAAPYAGQFELGVGLIDGWRKAGAFRNAGIPSESILSEQMGRITRDDLSDNPEIRFPAVNALRYLIGGFERNPWRPTRGQRRRRRPNGMTV